MGTDDQNLSETSVTETGGADRSSWMERLSAS